MTKLTRAELLLLIDLNADDPNRQSIWLGELAAQRIDAIRSELPNPKGTCSAGRRVFIDQKGAYSSGYVIHFDNDTPCGHAGEVWDADEPWVTALKREWANLKHIAKRA